MDRLISADKIADYVCDQCGSDICDRNPTYCVERDFIIACAKEMPEAVVRCKDCKHRDPEDHKCDSGALERAGCVFPVADDYFCALGERREDGPTD